MEQIAKLKVEVRRIVEAWLDLEMVGITESNNHTVPYKNLL